MKLKVITAICFLLVVLIACQSEKEIEFARYYSAGSVVYQKRCQNCHGSDGKGLAALIPALTNTERLKSIKETLPCLVRYGSKSAMNALGKSAYGEMPANNIPPMEVAQVLTYITNSFGNKLGTVTVDEAEQQLKVCRP